MLRAEVGDDTYEDFLGGLTGAGINVGIYPNLQLIGIHIRRIDPVSVDQTVVSVRPLLVDGAPAQVNWLRLRYHELFVRARGLRPAR